MSHSGHQNPIRTLGSLVWTAFWSGILLLALTVPIMMLTTHLDGWGRQTLQDGSNTVMWVCGTPPLVIWRTLPLYALAFFGVGAFAGRLEARGARWVVPPLCLPFAVWGVVEIQNLWSAVGLSMGVESEPWPDTVLNLVFVLAAVVTPFAGVVVGEKIGIWLRRA